jgi:hypothetical protein
MQVKGTRSPKGGFLIGLVVLILMVGGVAYYYLVLKKPTQIYSVAIDSGKTHRLMSRPSRGEPRGVPSINFYAISEAIDVSEYGQIKILNPEKLNLKLLEMLDNEKLVFSVRRSKKAAEQKRESGDVEYKELPVLEKVSGDQNIPLTYSIEVEKLESGKKYVLCRWIPRRPYPTGYFFVFTRQ